MSRLGLCVPGPGKPGHLPCIEQAARANYKQVAYQLTTPSDPTNWDSKPFLLGFKAALDRDLAVLLRLPHDPPVSPYWLSLTGGESWDTPYYPLPGTWSGIGGWHSRVRELCAGVVRMGYRTDKVRFALANEKGMGGANCASRGRWSVLRETYAAFKAAWKLFKETDDLQLRLEAKSLYLRCFPSWCWVNDEPLEEGEIPKECWAMLRRIRFSGSFSGFSVVAMSLECAQPAFEIESIAGPDAERYMGACPEIEANVYPGSAIKQAIQDNGEWVRRDLSPIELAERWGKKVDRVLGLIRMNPLLAPHRFGITETNVLVANVPAGRSVSEYRQALVNRAAQLSSPRTVGIFTALAQDGISQGAGLYTLEGDKLSPIGAEVKAA